MDRYFQRLIRRVFGEYHKQTIQPSIRIPGNFYDPFEKTAVRPLQYHEFRTSRAHSLANHKERDLLERKLQKISKHKLPDIGPPEVSPKKSLRRVDVDGISSSINYKNFKQSKSKPTISSDRTFIETKIPEQRVKKKGTDIPLMNIEPPIAETVKQKNEPSGTHNSKKVVGQTYLKTITAKSEKPSTSVDQLFRKTEKKARDAERSMVKHANHYVPPERVEPIVKPSFTMTTPAFSNRRSATSAAKENRLSIGNLVVDVVPVNESFHRRSSSGVRKTQLQKQSKSSLSRQSANRCFGLGQM